MVMADNSDNSAEFFERVGSLTAPSRMPNEKPGFGYATPLPRRRTEPDAAVQGREAVSCWAQQDNIYYGVTKAHDTIPAGAYRCEFRDNVGPVLAAQAIRTDTLIQLPDSASAAILAEMRRFRSRASRFRELGFLHKRGVLLWGPAGSGKSSTVVQLCDLIIEEERGIAIYVEHPELAAQCLQLVRRIEPNRPIVTICEDLDALIRRHGENEFLSLLDGESQVDNIINVATTNYPELLDRRFVDRPGRFASVRYIGMPSAASREVYVRTKLPDLSDHEVGWYVRASADLSIDHLREIIVLTQCDDMSLDEAEKRIRNMKRKPDSERSPERQEFGFSGNGDNAIWSGESGEYNA